MALQVGELFAKLTLQDVEFRRSLEAAERKMKDVAKASSAAFATIAGSITTAAVAASNYASASQSLALQTGLATEAVQALGYAARRSEADLDLLGRGMRSLVRRAADAHAGNEQLRADFAALGIDSERLAQGLADPEQLLLDVADGIARLPTEAQAASAAMNVMSDSGRRLVPFLRQGRGEIRGLMQESERLGLVMGRRMVQDLANFGDEWGTVQERIGAVSREIAVEFLPTIRMAMDAISNVLDRIQSMSSSTRELIGVIGSGTAGAVGSFAALTTGLWAAQRAMLAIRTVFQLASGPAGWITLAGTAALSLAMGMRTAERHTQAARQALLEFGTTVEITDRLKEIEEEMKKIDGYMDVDLTEPVIGGPKIRFSVEGELERELEELEEEARKLRERLAEIEREEREAEEAMKRLRDSMVSLGDAGVSGATGFYESWLESIDKVERELQVFRAGLLIRDESGERVVEAERVQELFREIQLREDVVRLSEEALRSDGLAADEVEEVNHALRMAQAELDVLLYEYERAVDALSSLDDIDPLGMIRHQTEMVRLLFDTGREGAEDMLAKVRELLSELDDLPGALTPEKLGLESTLQSLEARISATIEGERVPVSPADIPTRRPVVDRHIRELRLDRIGEELRLLGAQVEASLIPDEEAINELHRMRSALIGLTETGLANATVEQIELYNALTREIDAIIEGMERLPTEIERIRSEYERAMGVGRTVEQEIALATGVSFDELAYEIEVTKQHLQALATVESELTDDMEKHLRTLRLLTAEQERRLTIEQSVNAAIQGVTRQMGDFGRLFDGVVGFEFGEGFSFDSSQMMVNAALMVADALFASSDGSERTAELMERAANAIERASRGWQETLTDSQFHELLGADPQEEINELNKAIRANKRQVTALKQRWAQFWNAMSRGQQIQQLEDQIREMEALRQELEEGWESDLDRRLSEILGVTTRDMQGAVSGAFSADTAEEFTDRIERSLAGKVRDALVTAFIESELMAPLFEELGDEVKRLITDVDSIMEIDPGDIDALKELIEDISEEAKIRYEFISELELLADVTGRVNREFRQLVNVPMGFRALQELRFQSATPQVVPSMASNTQSRGGDMVFTGNITVEASDPETFERQMRRYETRRGLRRAGNRMAGRGRR